MFVKLIFEYRLYPKALLIVFSCSISMIWSSKTRFDEKLDIVRHYKYFMENRGLYLARAGKSEIVLFFGLKGEKIDRKYLILGQLICGKKLHV